MEKQNKYEIKHIKVLDGIRAFAIIIIVWFHFWQQSWISHEIFGYSLDFLNRHGYIFVDMLILLSSFCLFLPYARSMVYKEDISSTKKFYFDRFVRIGPSYIVAMVICLLLLLVFPQKISLSFFFKDTITHLFFIHNLFYDTLTQSIYFGVLWTLALEVQFYVLFPFLAKSFTKNPLKTYTIMVTISVISTLVMNILLLNNQDSMPLMVNHPLTFVSVYANGMMGAWLYIRYTKNKKRVISRDVLFTIISIICLVLYRKICNIIPSDIQLFQINYRYLISLLFLTFMISTILSHKIYRVLFENKLMKYIYLISFNLYIYHQYIAVKLVELRIPFWDGEKPPNVISDSNWQWKYFILCIILSLAVATFMTYCIEKPCANWIKKHFEKTIVS